MSSLANLGHNLGCEEVLFPLFLQWEMGLLNQVKSQDFDLEAQFADLRRCLVKTCVLRPLQPRAAY